MTNIKLCGLTRISDIEAVNALKPEYVGFVFAAGSRRHVSDVRAAVLRELLADDIRAVGVFVNEKVERVAELLIRGVIDMAQLHGNEDEDYIRRLRELTGKPVIRAFRVDEGQDISEAENSIADYVLLDSGAGGGRKFDWSRIKYFRRPYFLAGGLGCANVGEAIEYLHPYAVDVSSGIETEGFKDAEKMAAFVAAVREGERL